MLGKMYIAGAGWAYLALGDSAATMIGRRFGSRRWRWSQHKTIEGSVAYVLFGSVGAILLIKWIGSGGRYHVEFHPVFLAFLSIAGAVLAAFIESLPIKISDNIVPVLAGSFLIYIFCLIDPASTAANYHTWNLILGMILSMAGGYYVYRRKYGTNVSAVLLGLFGILLMIFVEIQGFIILALATSLVVFITTAFHETGQSPPVAGEGVADRTGEEEQDESTEVTTIPLTPSGIVSFLAIPLFFAFMSFSSAVRPEGVAGSTGAYLLFFCAYIASLGAVICHIASEVFGRLYARRRFSILTFHAASQESYGTITVEGGCAGLITSILLGVAAWILRMIPVALVPLVTIGAALGYVGNVYLSAVSQDRLSMGEGVARIIIGATAGAAAIILYLLYFLKLTL